MTILKRLEEDWGHSKRYSVTIRNLVETYLPKEYKAMWENIECDNRPEVVAISDLADVTYQEMLEFVRMDLVEEAVHRGDHEIFGYPPDIYRQLAYSGQIEDEAVLPDIDFHVFSEAILDYLNNNQILYETYLGRIVNVPIVEVW